MLRMLTITKMCKRCEGDLPLSEFHHHKHSKDGHSSYCKPCACIRSSDWRAANPEQNKRTQARCFKRKAAKYYIAHRKWCEENPERARAIQVSYRKRHREQLRITGRYRTRDRRARQYAVDEHFTVEMERAVKAFWNNQCAFCSSTERLQVDHWRPLSKGHALTMGNAVLLCSYCNPSKGTKLPEELDNQELVAAIAQQLTEQPQFWETWKLMAECHIGELMLA